MFAPVMSTFVDNAPTAFDFRVISAITSPAADEINMSPDRSSPRLSICDDRVIDVFVSFSKFDRCAASAFCAIKFKNSVIDADGSPPMLYRRRGGNVDCIVVSYMFSGGDVPK